MHVHASLFDFSFINMYVRSCVIPHANQHKIFLFLSYLSRVHDATSVMLCSVPPNDGLIPACYMLLCGVVKERY